MKRSFIRRRKPPTLQKGTRSAKKQKQSKFLVLGGAHDNQRNYPAMTADRCTALADPASTRKKRRMATLPRNRACGVAVQTSTIATSGYVAMKESLTQG